jgi:hypothetical protein
MKNIFALSIAFMFVFTGFVSLQSLQSTLHAKGGIGVVSLSVIYGSTVLSCLLAPWLINRITTKWTIVSSVYVVIAQIYTTRKRSRNTVSNRLSFCCPAIVLFCPGAPNSWLSSRYQLTTSTVKTLMFHV